MSCRIRRHLAACAAVMAGLVVRVAGAPAAPADARSRSISGLASLVTRAPPRRSWFRPAPTRSASARGPQAATRPHVYFNCTEGNPITHLVKFLIFGVGEFAPVTREVLRRGARPRTAPAGPRRLSPVAELTLHSRNRSSPFVEVDIQLVGNFSH